MSLERRAGFGYGMGMRFCLAWMTILTAAAAAGSEEQFRLAGWMVTSRSVEAHVRGSSGSYRVLAQGAASVGGMGLVSLNAKEETCVISWGSRKLTLYVGGQFGTGLSTFAAEADHPPVEGRDSSHLP